jgi:predicted transcriptional regulator
MDLLKQLLMEYKDVSAWMYKDLKIIPPMLAQHHIKLDTSIPPTHPAKYKVNLNYVAIIKQYVNKLLPKGFIQHIKKVTWV